MFKERKVEKKKNNKILKRKKKRRGKVIKKAQEVKEFPKESEKAKALDEEEKMGWK